MSDSTPSPPARLRQAASAYCWSTPARRTRRAAAPSRRFLRRFLSDPRVVELPRVLWLPLLYGLVLPLRAPRSAHKYRQIWQREGSPLLLHTSQIARGARARADRSARGAVPRRAGLSVLRAVRAPRPRGAARRPASAGCSCCRCFRRAAAATTGAVYDQVGAALRAWRALPELRYIAGYHADADYIGALAASVARALATARPQRPSADVVSRHPAVVRRAWRSLCRCSAARPRRCWPPRSIWRRSDWSLSFQSRFGANRWLTPGHRSEPAGAAAARHPRRHRALSGIRGRLPGDARGDRARRPRHLPARRRRALRLRAGAQRRAPITPARWHG